MDHSSWARRGGIARFAALLVLAAATADDAAAAISGVSSTGFLVTWQQEVKASPHRVYESLGEVGKWWNSDHTWSGNAANLSLQMQATGCFCERWDGGSVENGRVVLAARDSSLRIQGALGPLQALAVDAVLTFAVAEKDGKTILVVTYRVAGSESAGLAALAGPVDGVIGEQARRLAILRRGRHTAVAEASLVVPTPATRLRPRRGAAGGRRAGTRSVRRRSSGPGRRAAPSPPRRRGTAPSPSRSRRG